MTDNDDTYPGDNGFPDDESTGDDVVGDALGESSDPDDDADEDIGEPIDPSQVEGGHVGGVEPVGLEVEMQRSFLDYAMSVIVGRAIGPREWDGKEALEFIQPLIGK